jgi:hypothetical protein
MVATVEDPTMAATAPVIPLITCRIAGTGHHCTADTRSELRDGLAVDLRREADNEHDPDAIAVVTPDGRRLGYLPRRRNEVIARLLDAGKPLTATIREWSRPDDESPWLDITLAIALAE